MDVMTSELEAQALEALEALAVQEAALFAAQARQLHASAVLSEQLQGPDGLERFLVIDVAGTLRIGQLAAGHRLAQAERLVRTLTHTLAALETGAVLVPQARVVLEETDSCGPAVAAEVDERLHAGAPEGLAGWTGRRLRHRLKRLVLLVEAEREPGATAERLGTARRGRRVSVRPEPDGMASLWALLPAEQLRQFTLGLDELARRQRQADAAAGVERTADQRRADLLALLPALALHALDGTTPGPDCGHPAVVLTVHVPLATALGRSQAPAELDGYGPIPASAARRLLPGAALRRVLVDDSGRPVDVAGVRRPPAGAAGESVAAARARAAALADPEDSDGADGTDGTDGTGGEEADAGRHAPEEADAGRHAPEEPGYRPSAHLARLVRLRDPLCTGPGCASSSGRCDLDHERPWPAGPTSADNLVPRSRRCHRAKTLTWRVRRAPGGSHHWTSPTGRTYTVPAYWSPPPALGPPVLDPAPGGEDGDDSPDRLTAQLCHSTSTAELVGHPASSRQAAASGQAPRPARHEPAPF